MRVRVRALPSVRSALWVERSGVGAGAEQSIRKIMQMKHTSRTVVWLYKRCIIADELEGASDAGAKGDKVLGPCGIILRPTWGSACSIWCVKLRPLKMFCEKFVGERFRFPWYA